MKPHSFLSKEDTILLACLTQNLESQTQEDIINILKKNKLDWDYVLKKAAFNKVTPFLYKNLKDIIRDLQIIPQKILASLKDYYVGVSVQNMSLLTDLAKVLAAFNEASIKAMVIKGASLIEMVYKDISLRTMLDVDILIYEEDFSKVRLILQKLGFTSECEHFTPQEWSPVPLDCHLCFQKNETRIEIKFHIWGLDFPDFKTEKMWQETEKVKIAEQETLIPSPEYSLLIICIALVRHAFSTLIYYCDIKELIDFYKDRLNWEKLIDIAKEKSVEVPTYYGLFFAKSIVNANVPDYILERLCPNYLRRRVFELLWNKETILNLKEEVYQRLKKLNMPHEFKIIFFCGKLNFRPKKLCKLLSYILQAVFPAKRFLAKRYPTPHGRLDFLSFYISRLLRYWVRILRSGFLLGLSK